MQSETVSGFFDLIVTDIPYVIEREPNPDWRPPGGTFTNDQTHILVYAFSGRAHYHIGSKAYTISGGDVLIMPRGTAHTAASDVADPWHFVSIWFDAYSAKGNATAQLEALAPVWRSGPDPELVAMFSEIYPAWNTRHPGYLLQVRGLVTSLLYRIIRAHSLPKLRLPHVERMTKVTQMITENYRETYSVRTLAKVSGLSPSHFRSTFKRVVGVTATRYQQQVKIRRAEEFLVSGECNVTEAALRTGFNDVYYFSRLFKQMTGQNPSELTRR